MSEKSYIVALDAGGTAIKAAIYDETGHEKAVAGKVLPPEQPHPGWNERNYETMWGVACQVLREALKTAAVDPVNIAVVGLTGYGNGLCLVDASGTPVRNGILSSDQRSASIVERWRREGKEAQHLALTHQKLWAGKPLPLLQWIEDNEPGCLMKARYLLSCKDYLRFRLTEKFGLEIGDASSGSLLNHATRGWTSDILDLLELTQNSHLISEPFEPLTLAGEVSLKAAKETGLLEGTPVSAGYSDGPAMMLGLGVLGDDLLHVVAGTWGLNHLATNAPITDGSILASIFGPRLGDYVLVEGGANSASTFEWFVKNMLVPLKPEWSKTDLYRWCNAQVANTKDSDPPVFFLPYLNGRLDASEARGAFWGLSSWHTIAHMLRAVMEGVALEHSVQIDTLLTDRAKPKAVRFSGGAARSQEWLNIFAATLNCPLELGAATELGALGAAIVAAVGVGLYSDLESAVKQMITIVDHIEPEPHKVAIMAERKTLFTESREMHFLDGLSNFSIV